MTNLHEYLKKWGGGIDISVAEQERRRRLTPEEWERESKGIPVSTRLWWGDRGSSIIPRRSSYIHEPTGRESTMEQLLDIQRGNVDASNERINYHE